MGRRVGELAARERGGDRAVMDPVEQIAATVLYEGYVLWPYRRSARKNQQRWTFGCVHPRAYSEAHSDDPWLMQTQCLVRGSVPIVQVKVRFLQVVERRIGRMNAAGTLDFVDELRVGQERYLAWDEATERTIMIEDLQLADLAVPRRVPIAIPAGSDEEPIIAPDRSVAGMLVRSWRALQGAIEIGAEPVQDELFKLTVVITNTTPWNGQSRERTLRQTFASTHTILQVHDGTFTSLTDPPEELQQLAESCENIKTWPVLAGEVGDKHTMLSSPIILYDYPQVAPESAGDLFDGTEIDQLLLLNILTLTDEEKAEMRASDPRARAILERAESLTSEDFMQLHGAIREFRVLREDTDTALPTLLEELERPAPPHVVVKGVTLKKGSKVRLHPGSRGDIWDIALAGQVATIEAIEQDYEDRIHLAVILESDPGQDSGHGTHARPSLLFLARRS